MAHPSKSIPTSIDDLNQSGHLPPGMKIVPYYSRTDLINRTTDTVHENLVVGMALVTAILLMFLRNVRAAVIVAVNIPLALMFAFAVLFARGSRPTCCPSGRSTSGSSSTRRSSSSRAVTASCPTRSTPTGGSRRPQGR